MSDSSTGFSPFGTIQSAITRGDRAQLWKVRDSTCTWLKQNPGHERTREVHAALAHLDAVLGGRR